MLEEVKEKKEIEELYEETQETPKMDVDKAFEKIKEMTKQNNEIAAPAIDAIMNVLKENIDAKSDFSILHGFIALAKSIVFLSQALCENEDHFRDELDKSYKLTTNKVMPAIKSEKNFDGSKVEFDQEDYSLRRIMMALAQSMDVVFWDLLVSNYSEIRSNIEEEEEATQKPEE